jgi:methyl-accepting chemotaxis protein
VVKSETGSLAGDISNIVISMQFQDITRQRIEHVITPLEKFRAEYEKMDSSFEEMSLKIHDSGGNGKSEWLEGMYTMESERKLMRAALSRSAS